MTVVLTDELRIFYPLAGRICHDADGALAVEGDKWAEVLEVKALGLRLQILHCVDRLDLWR